MLERVEIISLPKPDAPCRNCTERCVGCHSKCERYRAFRSKRKSQQDALRAEKQRGADYVKVRGGNQFKRFEG